VDYGLVVVRALHFAGTVSTSGVLFFCIFIADPLVGLAERHDVALEATDSFYSRLRLVFGISLALALISGFAWFFFVVAEIGDRPVRAVFTDDLTWTVLSDTEFGRVWALRLMIGALLALAVCLQGVGKKPVWLSLGQALLAASFIASLAWAGHAAASPGFQGNVHLASDILHLVAVGAWLGGLLPYLLLLMACRRIDSLQSQATAITATQRFSNLGILAVGTILVTGFVNTWNMVGNVDALVGTDYGRLLLMKIALFLAMVSVATINRLKLSPRLSVGSNSSNLERNSLIELGLGLVILSIVGALGILSPPMHNFVGHVH
jgi:putative copper resistance protein D